MAFLPPSTDPRAIEVHHIDGDKTNTHVDNLRWATRLQNLASRLRRDSVIPGMTLNALGRFRVVVRCDGQRRRGTFVDFDQAVAQRNAWARELLAWIHAAIDAARQRYSRALIEVRIEP